MVARETCIPPLFCRNRRGECCRIRFRRGRVSCPGRCGSISRQSLNIDQDLEDEEMIFDFTKVKVSSYEFDTLDVFAITLGSELTRILLSMNISSTNDSIQTTAATTKTPNLLNQNRDAIINVKVKLAEIISSFLESNSIKLAHDQTRLPATNCKEFLALVKQCN